MKAKSGFILREIAGSWILIPVESRVIGFNGIGTLSEIAAMIWKKLESGAEANELAEMLTIEYGIDYDTAFSHVEEFIAELNEKGLVEL